MAMRNLLVAIVAIATISAFGRDLPILNGRLEGDLNANGHMVTNLAPPTATNDAATKGYVDAATNGIVVPTSWNAQSNTLDGVRRLDDMAVRTNAVTYSEWTWTSTNADLQASLIENNVVPVYIEDIGIDGHWIVAPMEANQWEVQDSYLSGVDSTAVVFPWWNPSFGIYDATATRTITTNIVVIDRIATTSSVNAAIADAAPDLTTYAPTNALVSLNQSVQYVTADSNGSAVEILAPTNSMKDWVVYIYTTTNNAVLFPTGTVYAADATVTNALTPNVMTALYLSSYPAVPNGLIVGRQEMNPVVIVR